MAKESVLGLDSAKNEAERRISNAAGPVSMIVSCSLILDITKRIEKLDSCIKSILNLAEHGSIDHGSANGCCDDIVKLAESILNKGK